MHRWSVWKEKHLTITTMIAVVVAAVVSHNRNGYIVHGQLHTEKPSENQFSKLDSICIVVVENAKQKKKTSITLNLSWQSIKLLIFVSFVFFFVFLHLSHYSCCGRWNNGWCSDVKHVHYVVPKLPVWIKSIYQWSYDRQHWTSLIAVIRQPNIPINHSTVKIRNSNSKNIGNSRSSIQIF